MRKYMIEFVVQGETDMDGLNQAELYLNTYGRCVDFNIRELSEEELMQLYSDRPESGRRLGPVVAKRLGDGS